MKLLTYFPSVLRILFGTVFILSGLFKLYPIEPFELNFIDLGVGTWFTAPFIARLLIAFEILLGLMLIFNLYLKSFTLKATLGLLVFFSIYLLVQLVHEGNNGNCGCFGTYLQMTPLESIFKNLLLISIAVFLFIIHPETKFRFSKVVLTICVITSVIIPFILNPIDLMAASQRQPEKVNFPLDLSLIYNDTISHKAQVDLSKGKHIVAFFSMTCSHCKATAFKIHVMQKQHPEIPFFMVLNGKETNLDLFFSETKSENVPWMILHGLPFAKITGGQVPTIYWMNDGRVVRKSNYISLEETEILNWLNSP